MPIKAQRPADKIETIGADHGRHLENVVGMRDEAVAAR